MNKYKKSQLSIFMIIGIIILVLFTFVFLLNGERFNNISGNSDKDAFKFYFDRCIQDKAANWLFVHGLHTGVYEGNNESFGLNNNYVTMPSISKTEFELGKFLSDNAECCLPKNFNADNKSIIRPADFLVALSDNSVTISYNDVYFFERLNQRISSGKGSINIEKRAKLIIENTDKSLNLRRENRYIKDDAGLQIKGVTSEIAIDNDSVEHWLITDNKNMPDDYFFAYLAFVDK